jgi:GT2 family glycosyltransferase
VRVVVVNYDGGESVVRGLRAVLATEWDPDRLEVVMVDNASSDGSPARVRAELPRVRVVDAGRNLGFAGGCNLGMGDLAGVDHVALLNPDAVVEPGWLEPLVAALEDDPGVGAACPKMLFAPSFVEVALGTADRHVAMTGARLGGGDVSAGVQHVTGFGPAAACDPQPSPRRLDGPARVRIPVPPGTPVPVPVELGLIAARPAQVEIEGRVHDLGSGESWCPVSVTGPVFDVVNNAGTDLLADGYGVDRGYLDPDDGRHDRPAEVFAWSGGAVVLPVRYLHDVGRFDERFFLYYEDLDLAWRGRRRGWRYRYVPDSVVRHEHGASTGIGSPLFRYHNERNRLLALARNGPLRLLAVQSLRFLLATASYARRDIAARLVRGRRPCPEVTLTRLRAFAGYLRLLPGSLRRRRS